MEESRTNVLQNDQDNTSWESKRERERERQDISKHQLTGPGEREREKADRIKVFCRC